MLNSDVDKEQRQNLVSVCVFCGRVCVLQVYVCACVFYACVCVCVCVPSTEAVTAAELQHTDGSGGRSEQQLHLQAQGHTGPHQHRNQQGADHVTSHASQL